MSARGRGAEVAAHEFYPTPPATVRAILDRLDLPGGRWLEPSAGDGAIVRAAARADVTWTACELRADARAVLEETGAEVVIGDFFDAALARGFEVAILNPPFSEAVRFVSRCMLLARHVVALLRLNWLETLEREWWLRRHAPDVYVLPCRPSFTGGGTDATAYAWMHWPAGAHNRSAGLVEVLPSNPRQMELLP